MLLFGMRDCLKLSSAGVIFLALSFCCPAQTSRVAGDIQGSIADQSGTANRRCEGNTTQSGHKPDAKNID